MRFHAQTPDIRSSLCSFFSFRAVCGRFHFSLGICPVFRRIHSHAPINLPRSVHKLDNASGGFDQGAATGFGGQTVPEPFLLALLGLGRTCARPAAVRHPAKRMSAAYRLQAWCFPAPDRPPPPVPVKLTHSVAVQPPPAPAHGLHIHVPVEHIHI